jgi:AraC-like DNA-binding protein
MQKTTPSGSAARKRGSTTQQRRKRTARLKKRDTWLQAIDPDHLFHRLFDALPGVYFFAKNRQGEFMFLSRSNRDRCRFADDAAFIGLNDFDVNPEELARSYVLDDARILATGEPLFNRVELWFDQLGIPDWFVVNKMPIWSRDGEIIGVMGFSQSYESRAQLLEPLRSISKAVNFLRDNHHRPITITQLAAVAGLSPRQLERSFKATFSLSPQQFLIRTRLLAACRRLTETRQGIGELAYASGFGDQSAFTRHFRRHIGMTPSQYRAR